ncbi:hypothetical protein ES708_03682 [subsurface metagenome]
MTGIGLLREAERETWPAPQEGKYLRLVAGKVIYVSEAEVMKEEVLAGPRKKLNLEETLGDEWNCRVEEANQLKERISLVHQMMRDDEQRPSQYEPAYNSLWNQYRDAVESLRELDSEAIDQFRSKVLTRLKELEARINSLNDLKDPDYFNYYEKMLTVYAKTHDQAVVLGWEPPQPQLPEAKHPCYKTDSLCRLAENSRFLECIYESDTCPWRARAKSRQDGISK